METVLNIIQTLGFPIACCCFLGYFIKKQSDEYRNDVKTLSEKSETVTREIAEKYETALRDMTEKYDRQIDKFSKTIDKNTQVLTALETRLELKGGSDND